MESATLFVVYEKISRAPSPTPLLCVKVKAQEQVFPINIHSSSNYSSTIILLSTLGVIGFFAFMPFDWGVQRDAMSLTFNASHFPAFLVLAIALFRAQKPNGATRRAALICLVLAISIELIQPWIGREASIYDVMIGLFGTAAGLMGVSVWKRRASRRVKLAYAGLVTGAITMFAFPAMLLWGALAWHSRFYPLLGDFENEIERVLWAKQGVSNGMATGASLSSDYASRGKKSLRLETVKGAWAGVKFDVGQKNWADYDYLGIDVFNPGNAFTLNIRIDDKDSTDWYDRFQKPVTIKPGWNHIELDMAHIESTPPLRYLRVEAIQILILYTGKQEPSRVFYIDNVRLAKKGASASQPIKPGDLHAN